MIPLSPPFARAAQALAPRELAISHKEHAGHRVVPFDIRETISLSGFCDSVYIFEPIVCQEDVAQGFNPVLQANH